jgi:lipopolysaccharide/colanic/teichoic acid biosynthesis glycosyltransferase
MKRLVDIVLSVFTILAMAPLLAAVALAVRLQDGGPSLFGQIRVGQHGREFRMWKFRSMVVDAPRLGGYSTADGDPRITPIGRFIRRSSIDELPQVFNVLLGDMSIVGPRPDVPAQRALYADADWQLRHQVRPGITGLAQATLRSEATADQRKELDLRYAREAGLWLDLRIIAMTFRQIFFKGGN